MTRRTKPKSMYPPSAFESEWPIFRMDQEWGRPVHKSREHAHKSLLSAKKRLQEQMLVMEGLVAFKRDGLEEMLRIVAASSYILGGSHNNSPVEWASYTTVKYYQPKNDDYGDAFAMAGIAGILIRILDKLARYETLHKKKGVAQCEAAEDTVIDVGCYAVMGLMLLHEDG